MFRSKPKPGILIFGERNTGTGYIEKLVNLNLENAKKHSLVSSIFLKLPLSLRANERVTDVVAKLNHRVDGGWKHCKVDPRNLKRIAKRRNIKFITLTKNPYSFCLSLYRNPYHAYSSDYKDFYNFLTTPWKTRPKDKAGKKELSSPLELWNIKNKSYIEACKLDPGSVLNLKWEDLVNDPQGVIQQVSDKFGIALKKTFFTNSEESTKGKDSRFRDYQKYYIEEQWRKELDSASIKFINQNLDPEVVKYFGYSLIKK